MKKLKAMGILAMSAILLTGCIDAMPNLTSEQSDMISEYAAGLLLKYSPNYDYKIVSDEEVAAAMELESETMETENGQQTEEDADSTDKSEADVKNEADIENETEIPETEIFTVSNDMDFASELGIDGVILKYQSFEICSSYPNDNVGFSVDAAQGKKLLVVHFDLEGSSNDDVECNIFDYDLKIRFNINDSISKNALSTMLMNELASYIDTIPAGEYEDVVAVAEIDDISETEIESLTIQMMTGGNSCTVQLIQ